jgi:hypothetical protein
MARGLSEMGDTMIVVGFNFTKMSVERKQAPQGKISIRNNINIKDIRETDLPLGKSKESGLVFTFELKYIYDPEIGEIDLVGELIYLIEAKKEKDVLDKWKKDKKVEPDVLENVLNAAISKCSIQALILSRDINLPAPIPMQQPRLVVKKE